MDDRSFQQELHAIKQRVTDLSIQSPPISSTMDPFTRQLDDLNNIFRSMDERLTKYKAGMNQPAHSPPPAPPQAISHEAGIQMQTSGPDVWKLYNDLRTHTRNLESRLTALTSTVSDLEDRIDSLDPNRFTPPASTDGSSDGVTPGPHLQHAWTFPFLNPAPLPVPSSNAATDNQALDGPLDTLMAPRTDSALRHAQPPQLTACLFSSRPEPQTAHQNLQHTRDMHPTFNYDSLNEMPNATRWSYPSRQTTSGLIGASRYECRDVSIPQHPQSSLGGLAFRDREIARMDERLYNAQENLKNCEASIAEDQRTMARLRSEREECRAIARKYRDKSHRLKDQMSQDLRNLDVQVVRNRELEGLLAMRSNRVRDLEAALVNSQRSQEAAVARARESNHRLAEMEAQTTTIRRDYDAKLKDLQESCEEQVSTISRLAHMASSDKRLLAQRENAIEMLQGKIRLLENATEGDMAVRLAPAAPDCAPEDPSTYTPNQDWDGNLIDTDDGDETQKNEPTNTSVQLAPLSATVSAPPGEPVWIAPTDGPYNDGSILYGVDPSESEETPRIEQNESEASTSEPAEAERRKPCRGEGRPRRMVSPPPACLGGYHPRNATIDKAALHRSHLSSIPNRSLVNPRRMVSESDLRAPPRWNPTSRAPGFFPHPSKPGPTPMRDAGARGIRPRR